MTRPQNSWSVEPGRSLTLHPPRCGHLRATSGCLRANGEVLGLGRPLRVWSGERVLLSHCGEENPAFFAWDYCSRQPKPRTRLQRLVQAAFAR